MEWFNVEQSEMEKRLDSELERAQRQKNPSVIRALMRVKYGTVYGPKETWRPKLKEDWDD